MGKRSGKILGLIALIISAGVGGYVLYDNFIAVPPSTGNQWYDYTNSIDNVALGQTWDTYTQLFIDFTVSEGETVHFLYVGHVLFDVNSGDSYVEIKFTVDGIRWDFPYIRVSRSNVSPLEGIRLSVALQHYNTTMPPGSHTVTIAFRGDSIADALYVGQSLFVQTFN